ncbi:ribosome biogenesis GTP-binding protein YsxC [Enterobacteriaceae endosymbiont of Plateumaris consimilis]|uniref:ribosome biogenesis GTP-binding protein YihA/YsxC n=1 Tax=Enterobacteriaceae endosymbiont of Plateumaris consimilis TaxID=2675794 RepID=UPI00144A0DD5|nr:ribosome biogenesis GTP-binding protein YihA/YsxC [Enterobacteriaceae endosymbiont of Plateumaris consimilis]QJC28785.1 ribosome biogenesis GTP-binding protein YsxC [Enterobacteriaceae endosymbiont of Plateumaris consimilis]
MIINFQSINFINSILSINELTYDYGNEIAFIGYTNVGKSTIINLLFNQKIARTSKTPGCTCRINIFKNDQEIRFLDFPGYGYSKFLKQSIFNTYDFFQKYILIRNSLKGIILIIDIRFLFRKIDLILLQIFINKKKSILIILNKSDKLSNILIKKKIYEIKKILVNLDLLNKFDMKIKIVTCSALKKENLRNIKKSINFLINN